MMDFVSEVERVLSTSTCIVGLGNYIKSDDAVGLYIAEGVRDKVNSGRITVINVEDVLENYIFKIAEQYFNNVIIIDAIKSFSKPGSVIFGRLEDFKELIGNYSTHKLCLATSGKILENNHKRTYLLGIEVLSADFGIGLSEEIRQIADMVIDMLITSINCTEKEYVYEH